MPQSSVSKEKEQSRQPVRSDWLLDGASKNCSPSEGFQVLHNHHVKLVPELHCYSPSNCFNEVETTTGAHKGKRYVHGTDALAILCTAFKQRIIISHYEICGYDA